jgi:glutamate racemase
LQTLGLMRTQTARPDYRYVVTDVPLRFQTIGERFLGRSLGQVERFEW